MTQYFQPKFGTYYTKEWLYSDNLGVGLKFIGKPTNINEFLTILQEVSCNPVAAHRILNDLIQHGQRVTTVMNNLPFQYIGDMLKEIGVTMEIVEPKISPFSMNTDIVAFQLAKGEDANLGILTANELPEALLRAKNAQKSFKETPHNFGPFDPNFNIETMLKKQHNYKPKN